MNYVDTSKESPVILSLCSGIRGLERGIERAIGQPLRICAYVEIETFIIENLLAGMEAGILAPTPIWTDIKTFPWDSFHGKIHGIIGGYPCQPFSVAGARNGTEDPRHLWPYIANGIRAIRPIWCFFENVPGHLTLGYETVRGELQEMGYHVKEGIFSAEEVGAPHRRERLFILAVLADTSNNNRGLSESEGRIYNTEITGASKTELGDSESYDQWNDSHQTGNEKFKVGGTGIGLANPQSNRRNSSTFSENDDKKVYREGRCGFDNSSKNGKTNTFTVWPAKPGVQQYDWEEPRTIKSGVGCTVNGYNFREDLLRAFGNGVVEQTSELAWKILWSKICNLLQR